MKFHMAVCYIIAPYFMLHVYQVLQVTDITIYVCLFSLFLDMEKLQMRLRYLKKNFYCIRNTTKFQFLLRIARSSLACIETFS